jgi:glycosyltransferase involved in cell wall biosynthesis
VYAVSLSVALVTRNSEAYVERTLQAVRGLADELIVAVDGSSTDATEDVSAYYADRLFRLEPLGDVVESTFAWLIDQCRADWILRIDDDELPSQKLVGALGGLLDSRNVTHYWFRRRWLAGPDGRSWLVGTRWWPDWQLRLFRNISSLVQAPAGVHHTYAVSGAGQYVNEGALYHFDHLVHTLQERVEKCYRYERDSPANQHWQTYLPPPDEVLATSPIPEDDPPWSGVETRFAEASNVCIVPVDQLQRAQGLDYRIGPELFQATLTCLDTPPTMAAGHAYWLTVEVRNDGSFKWFPSEAGRPWVRIGYHWLRDTGDPFEVDGLRADLPGPLRPGETSVVPAWVLAPMQAGNYRLQWDLVIEFVNWFSDAGWSAPSTAVRVERAARPLDARRAHALAVGLGVPRSRLDTPDARRLEELAPFVAEMCSSGSNGPKPRSARPGSTPGRAVDHMPPKPPLTVIMPVRNAARYLREAVTSILTQEFDAFEFVIVNDGSTDDSANILRRFASVDKRIRVITTAQQGVARALNLGLASARSELVARMDADDISLPGRLGIQYRYMQIHPDCALVGSMVQLIDEAGREFAIAGPNDPDIRLSHEEIDVALLTAGWPIVHPTTVLRSRAVAQLGGYCSDFRAAQDHDLFLRLAEVGQLHNLPIQLLRYRRHPDSLTSWAHRSGLNEVGRAIERAVDRRRQAAMMGSPYGFDSVKPPDRPN